MKAVRPTVMAYGHPLSFHRQHLYNIPTKSSNYRIEAIFFQSNISLEKTASILSAEHDVADFTKDTINSPNNGFLEPHPALENEKNYGVGQIRKMLYTYYSIIFSVLVNPEEIEHTLLFIGH